MGDFECLELATSSLRAGLTLLALKSSVSHIGADPTPNIRNVLNEFNNLHCTVALGVMK